jgi:hypothetical protein
MHSDLNMAYQSKFCCCRLGCFDAEEQAARAYDRMMIWCHLHKELSAKHGITNYDMKEYEAEYDWLMSISQEDLIESLRCDGRKQAATRQLRNKQSSSMGVAHFEGQKGERKGARKVQHSVVQLQTT